MSEVWKEEIHFQEYESSYLAGNKKISEIKSKYRPTLINIIDFKKYNQ